MTQEQKDKINKLIDIKNISAISPISINDYKIIRDIVFKNIKKIESAK